MTPLRTLLALMLGIAASPAFAWWDYGHRTVAAIAWTSVAPRTRAAIGGLLRRQALLGTPTCPARTLEEASIWPDCIKTLGDRFSYASSWHYQNVDICRAFELKAACRDGNCVSAQIERAVRLLKDRTVPARERVMALAFLVHFVGDLHMPLHAGDHGDLGGNRVSAAYGVIEGRTNLHMVWDGLLAERAISTPPGGAAGIVSGISPARREAIAGGTVEDWSRESWQLSRDAAYAALPDGACGPAPATRVRIDEARTQALIPVVRQQIARGGFRLARLLDDALR